MSKSKVSLLTGIKHESRKQNMFDYDSHKEKQICRKHETKAFGKYINYTKLHKK